MSFVPIRCRRTLRSPACLSVVSSVQRSACALCLVPYALCLCLCLCFLVLFHAYVSYVDAYADAYVDIVDCACATITAWARTWALPLSYERNAKVGHDAVE